ncbi:MBL fold metallo-hydrolase [Defluviitalea raffinosedens]|uniref:MBL fold metallo-hydrolase n=1 Tax=Defluviitalea raffinosedens TaxID=1450156 RepID=A0A7C8HFD0_9FIRM|nr:MBL fold metallo-hydrolase [Defluviitalea raffinosedens]KAE9629463.1 MBL fold metallo-hydrolase [Defluviitalea raffinosedens]
MSIVQRVKCGNGNYYIVSEGDSAILIDTGKKEYLYAVLEACKPYKMKLIVLTHAHFDHTENAAVLSERFGVPIAMHQDDMNLIESNNNQSMSYRTFMGKIVLSASLRDFSKRKMTAFTPSVFLKDGDELAEYGIQAKVIGLPGHTKGSIGIDVGGKDLIVGDALMNMFYPTVSMLYNDENVMLNSAKKITDLGERTIYFGHGKPVPNKVWVK